MSKLSKAAVCITTGTLFVLSLSFMSSVFLVALVSALMYYALESKREPKK